MKNEKLRIPNFNLDCFGDASQWRTVSVN